MGDSSPESDIEELSSSSPSSSTSSSPSTSPSSRGQKKTTSTPTMWGSSSSQGWPPVTGGQIPGGPPQGAAGPASYNWSSSMGWEAAGSAGGSGGSSWNERQPGWNLQQPGIDKGEVGLAPSSGVIALLLRNFCLWVFKLSEIFQWYFGLWQLIYDPYFIQDSVKVMSTIYTFLRSRSMYGPILLQP